ncbi:MAG TPA: sigma-70 family RNA polymerase sigma factor, partial [Lacipirellulaceae bacterium]|nr:sigma-70 family RNA polymerase sigma factor [Lacipirellulaceae bacterium]
NWYDVILRHIEFSFPEQLAARTSPQDILQETYIRAYRAIDRFKPSDQGSFSGWLRTIADNVLRDELRRSHRDPRARRPESAAGSSTSSITDFVGSLDGDEPEPHANMGQNELLQAFNITFASLEPHYQQAITLCGLQGQSYQALAEALQVTPDAARGIYVRARQKMKQGIVRLSLYI